MKQFIDDEYVGYGKLVYGDPVCTWLAEHELRRQGYQRIVIPHVHTWEITGNKIDWELASWRVIVAHNVHLMIKSTRDLPLKLYSLWTFDGGMTLVPFVVQRGGSLKTNARDSTNQPVFVNVVMEPLIRLF